MEKIIKLVFSCIGGIIVVKILGMCILGSVPAGDFGTIPIMLSLIVAYMFFVSCLSVWAYKKIRSIIGVNVTIFMLNIITGYMFYSQKKFTLLVYSLMLLGVTLICTLITKFVLWVGRKNNSKYDNSLPNQKNSILNYKYNKNEPKKR